MAFVPVADAPSASLSDILQRAEASVSGIEISSPKDDFRIHSDNASTSTELKLTRATFAAVVRLVLIAAMVFVILQCFRALTSGRRTGNQGAARGLAEKGETPCSVGHHIRKAALAAAMLAFRGSIFVGGTERLSLRLCLKA